MNDLVYCCAHCLGISVAASIDEASARKCRNLRFDVVCTRCGEPSSIAVSDAMFTSSLTERGDFRPIKFEVS